MTEGLDRRRFARFPSGLQVTAWAAQFRHMTLHGTVCNLGAGGVMADFLAQIVPGSSLQFLIQSGSGTLRKEGRVVWTALLEGQVRHGIAFLNPEDSQFALDLSGATLR